MQFLFSIFLREEAKSSCAGKLFNRKHSILPPFEAETREKIYITPPDLKISGIKSQK